MQSDTEAVAPAARPRRTHPLTVIGGFAAIAAGTVMNLALGGGGIELVLQIFGALSVVRWWFKTYELGPNELTVREGVFSRRQQVVPYRRVQQVDVRRSAIMQIFGLAALRIETAGSQAGTVGLSLLDVKTADELRAFVLARRRTSQATLDHIAEPPAALEDERRVLEVTGAQLLLAGATATLPLLVGMLAAALVLPSVALAIALDAAFSAVAIGLVVAFGVTLVGSTLGHVLNFAGYSVAVSGDDLRLSYGLLDRQHVNVPRARVQHVEISDNPLRRMLGYASVRLRSAARVGASGPSGRLDIPIVARDQVPAVLANLMGDTTWTPPALELRPAAARRRGIVRRAAVLLVPALVAFVAVPVLGLVAGALAVVLGVAWGTVAHRRAGHALTPSIAAFASGAVVHEMHLVPIARIQSARTKQSPFQRHADLATIALDIAGTTSAPSLYDTDATTARMLRSTLPSATGSQNLRQ